MLFSSIKNQMNCVIFNYEVHNKELNYVYFCMCIEMIVTIEVFFSNT